MTELKNLFIQLMLETLTNSQTRVRASELFLQQGSQGFVQLLGDTAFDTDQHDVIRQMIRWMPSIEHAVELQQEQYGLSEETLLPMVLQQIAFGGLVPRVFLGRTTFQELVKIEVSMGTLRFSQKVWLEGTATHTAEPDAFELNGMRATAYVLIAFMQRQMNDSPRIVFISY